MQPDAPITRSGQKKARLGMLLLVVLTAAACAYLIHQWRELGFEWGEFAGTFQEMRWGWVSGASALALLTYLGRALRWRVLLFPLRRDSNLWNLISATAIGFTAVVLFGRAGELVRPYLISVKEEVPFSSQIAAWVTERLYDLLMALLLFGIGLSHIQNSGIEVGPRLQWILRAGGYAAAGIGLASLLILFVFGRYASRMQQRMLDALTFLPEHLFEKAAKAVSEFSRSMEGTGRGPLVSQLVLYSLLEWLLIVACYLCVLRAVPATAGFLLTDVVILVGFTAFGAIIQIPGVGGGAQVVIVIILTEMYHIGLEASSSLAILIWLITFVVIVPVGLLLAFHEGLTWRKLRRIEEEVRA